MRLGLRVIWSCVLLGLPAGGFAQTVTASANGAVSVRAAAVPLASAVNALADVASFEQVTLPADLAAMPVTVDVQNVSPRRALIAILDAADIDYAMSASSDGRRVRLVITATGGGRHLQSAALTLEPRRADTSEWRDSTAKAQKPDEPVDVEHERATQQRLEEGQRATQFHVNEMHALLSTPHPVPTPGTRIELPFPAPDGGPLEETVGAAIGPSGTATRLIPAVGPGPVAPADQALKSLELLLLSARRPGG